MSSPIQQTENLNNLFPIASSTLMKIDSDSEEGILIDDHSDDADSFDGYHVP